MPIHSQTFLNALPPEWHVPLLPLIQAHVADAAKVVVLDDDPTGTQTVHGVPVLTGWSTQALAGELRRAGLLLPQGILTVADMVKELKQTLCPSR